MRRALLLVMCGLVMAGAGIAIGRYVVPSNRASTSSSVAHSTPTHTTVEVFSPFTFSGISPDVTISSTASGSCWEGSVSVGDNPDAWRCFEGKYIEDPCFSPPHDAGTTSYVLCIEAPWDTATRLDLTSNLPTNMANEQAPPNVWAIRLANRDGCIPETGAAGEFGGVAMNWICGSGNDAGNLDTSVQPWTVEYHQGSSDVLLPVAITTAWNA